MRERRAPTVAGIALAMLLTSCAHGAAGPSTDAPAHRGDAPLTGAAACARLDLTSITATIGTAVVVDPTRSDVTTVPPATRSVRCVLVAPGSEGRVQARSVGSITFSSYRTASSARASVDGARQQASELGTSIDPQHIGDVAFASASGSDRWYCAAAVGRTVAGADVAGRRDVACALAGRALDTFGGTP